MSLLERKQVAHTRDVMLEVEAVSGQYESLAVACSQLYFALETLRDVHFLYHFSLRFFQDILAEVIKGSVMGSVVYPRQRCFNH